MGLSISGDVKRFATISPSRVQLTGPSDQPVTQTVTILTEPDYPFTIKAVRTRRDGDIEVRLETVKKDGRDSYMVTISNQRHDKSRYYNSVILETDSPIQPEIVIGVYGNILEPAEGGGKADPS